ncbi:MAG: hypothetical protein MEQ07_11630 [Aquimonas sp.]|nr:hypothetical protein [Aquimonas sp.]
MTRFRAFALHLLLSLAIIGGVAFGLFALWYPPSLLGFAKADRLFTLIAAIDIVAGPLLTLIVYKVGKPSLKFDLTVIALLQAAFLGLGLWTAWSSRPVFLVAATDRFELVFAHEVAEADRFNTDHPELARLSWTGPKRVGLRPPASGEEMMERVDAGMAGLPSSRRPRYYQPFELSAPMLVERAKPAAALPEYSHMLERDFLQRVAADHAEQPEARFVPVESSRGFALFQIDPQSGKPLRYVP